MSRQYSQATILVTVAALTATSCFAVTPAEIERDYRKLESFMVDRSALNKIRELSERRDGSEEWKDWCRYGLLLDDTFELCQAVTAFHDSERDKLVDELERLTRKYAPQALAKYDVNLLRSLDAAALEQYMSSSGPFSEVEAAFERTIAGVSGLKEHSPQAYEGMVLFWTALHWYIRDAAGIRSELAHCLLADAEELIDSATADIEGIGTLGGTEPGTESLDNDVVSWQYVRACWAAGYLDYARDFGADAQAVDKLCKRCNDRLEDLTRTLAARDWPGHAKEFDGPGDPDKLADSAKQYLQGVLDQAFGPGERKVLSVSVGGPWEWARKNPLREIVQWRLPLRFAVTTNKIGEEDCARVYDGFVYTESLRGVKKAPPWADYECDLKNARLALLNTLPGQGGGFGFAIPVVILLLLGGLFAAQRYGPQAIRERLGFVEVFTHKARTAAEQCSTRVKTHLQERQGARSRETPEE